jgi:hypothetical protein
MNREYDTHKMRLVNEEQRRHMERHRLICSNKVGYDIGETGFYDWVEKYAADFRAWVETIPFNCLECGFCTGFGLSGLCHHPFDDERSQRIK